MLSSSIKHGCVCWKCGSVLSASLGNAVRLLSPAHANKNVIIVMRVIVKVLAMPPVVNQHLCHIGNVVGNFCVGIASGSCPMLASCMKFQRCPQKQPFLSTEPSQVSYYQLQHFHMRHPTGAKAPGPRPVRRAGRSWHLVLLRRAGLRAQGGHDCARLSSKVIAGFLSRLLLGT